MNSKRTYRSIAVALLALIAVQRYAIGHRSADVEQYQARIRAAGTAVPERVGAWVGEDVPVPVQARTVLKPNVMISRRYVNVEDGTSAGLLLVHCGNAHHMAGHFPLRCYPARGWKVRSAKPRDWNAGGLLITGTEYEFHKDAGTGGEEGEKSMIVVNCILRPNGQVLRDMDSMSRTIIGAGGAASGAGQVQVYFDSAVPRGRRDAAVEAILGGVKPLIEAIIANPSAAVHE